MEIIFLGTAGAVSRKERDNTSLLFKSKENYFLIDTPGSLVQKLKKSNIDYFKINHIFLTHSHPDHIYGLPSFIHSRMFDNSSTIYLYSHKNTFKVVKKLLKIFGLYRDNFPKLKFVKLKDSSRVIPFGDFEIIAFKVNHTPESLGLKIKTAHHKIVFSSDTTYCQRLIQESKNVDYLIHDCFAPERFFITYPNLHKMHTSTKTLIKIAKETEPKILIPIHFSGELEFETDEIKKEIEQEIPSSVYMPIDLERIS